MAEVIGPVNTNDEQLGLSQNLSSLTSEVGDSTVGVIEAEKALGSSVLIESSCSQHPCSSRFDVEDALVFQVTSMLETNVSQESSLAGTTVLRVGRMAVEDFAVAA